MPIDFLVVASERSASTWVANWLTTDDTICYHDPLLRWTHDQLGKHKVPGKLVGASCTGSSLYPEWVNRQLCPTIILHRNANEIAVSWARSGVQPLAPMANLDLLAGIHYHWNSVFDPVKAAHIYEYLLNKFFDAERHKELVQMNVQPHFSEVAITARGLKSLMARIGEALATP